jgi:hypothetical protein
LINRCNASKLISEASGAAAIKDPHAKISYLILSNVLSESFCGIALTQKFSKTEIKSSIFYDIVSTGSDGNCSIIKLAESSKCEVLNSAFARIYLGSSPFFLIDDNGVFSLKECSFDLFGQLLSRKQISLINVTYNSSNVPDLTCKSPYLKKKEETAVAVERRVKGDAISYFAPFLVFFAGVLFICVFLISKEEISRSKHYRKAN